MAKTTAKSRHADTTVPHVSASQVDIDGGIAEGEAPASG
jgi:hypothetical protein